MYIRRCVHVTLNDIICRQDNHTVKPWKLRISDSAESESSILLHVVMEGTPIWYVHNNEYVSTSCKGLSIVILEVTLTMSATKEASTVCPYMYMYICTKCLDLRDFRAKQYLLISNIPCAGYYTLYKSDFKRNVI